MSGGNDYLSDLPVLELGTLTACLDGLDEYEAAYYTIMGSSYNLRMSIISPTSSSNPSQHFCRRMPFRSRC